MGGKPLALQNVFPRLCRRGAIKFGSCTKFIGDQVKDRSLSTCMHPFLSDERARLLLFTDFLQELPLNDEESIDLNLLIVDMRRIRFGSPMPADPLQDDFVSSKSWSGWRFPSCSMRGTLTRLKHLLRAH